MEKKIAAIILAAGYSSRMGAFKPLLKLDGQTILERIINAFKAADIAEVSVVVGYRHQELTPVIEQTKAQAIFNPNYEDGMFSSVAAGLKRVPAHVHACCILPADVPLVRSWTLSYLCRKHVEYPDKVLRPCFKSIHGHPPLIPAIFFKEIIQWKGKNGLKGALSNLTSQSLSIKVADEHILSDMDTPEDYEKTRKRWNDHNIPTMDECEAILNDICQVNASVYKHCRAVAAMAVRIARKLNQFGCQLNLALIEAAGMLHDIAKGRPNHAHEGGRILKQMGFPEVADAVVSHMDINIPYERPIGAAEIIFLADKLVQEDRVMPIESVFQKKMQRFGHIAEARNAIENRLNSARTIQNRIASKTGGCRIEGHRMLMEIKLMSSIMGNKKIREV